MNDNKTIVHTLTNVDGKYLTTKSSKQKWY